MIPAKDARWKSAATLPATYRKVDVSFSDTGVHLHFWYEYAMGYGDQEEALNNLVKDANEESWMCFNGFASECVDAMTKASTNPEQYFSSKEVSYKGKYVRPKLDIDGDSLIFHNFCDIKAEEPISEDEREAARSMLQQVAKIAKFTFTK